MSLTLEESRARAQLQVAAYDVHLDLTSTDAFGSRTRVSFRAEPGSATFLELADARDVTATLNGAPVEYVDGRIALADLAATNVVVVEARLPYVTNGDGMHTFTDPADGERYVSAYCGMDIAHHVFACFDQPDLKAPIRLSVTAAPAWTVLGNGRPVRRWGGYTSFARTPAISPYLFVVSAGPWHSVAFEHAGLPFGWHARRSLAAELERDADKLESLTRACFDHFTTIFDAAYPFDSYDQVFVPGLNWGAMEQPGCVLFRDEYLTRGTPSAAEDQWRATVVAHEMAHMWFGDLVTMRWWEDSWLNESFADYMGYEVARVAGGHPGTWVGCALNRKPTAYAADARRSTHPVAENTEAMTDVDTAFGNFDMITYAKGNAVLRQLVTWLGERDFLAGANAYLSGHAFGNADLGDFLTALDRSTDRDVRGWAELWLRTTGFDTLRVERDGDVPVLHRDGTRPHRFHVAAYDAAGVLVDERLVDLADEPLPLPEYAGLAVVPNSQDETYAALALDPLSWDLVAARLGDLADPLTRAMLWASVVDRVAAGALPLADLLALVARHLPGERDPLILEDVLLTLERRVLPQWLAPDELAAAEATVADVARAVLAAGAPDLEVAASRALAATSADTVELAGWLERTGTDTDLRWAVVRRLAELGHATAAQVDAEMARDTSAGGARAALRARAAMPTAAAKAAAWGLMHADTTSNSDFHALADGFWARGQADVLAPYLGRYVAEAPGLAERRGQAFSKVIGRAFPFLALPVGELTRLRNDLADRLDRGGVPTVLARSLADRLDDLDVALRVRRSTPEDRFRGDAPAAR